MATMTVEQMDAVAEKLAAVASKVVDGEEVEESDDSDLNLHETLQEALDIMKRCAVFFDYASDKVLVTNLTNPHRALMTRLSSRIYDFVEEAEQVLEDSEE